MKIATCATAIMGAAVFAAVPASAQSWSSPQRLNDPSQTNGDVKEPAICVAAGGGFHVAYRYHIAGGPVQMVYRRYQAGSLSPVSILHQSVIFGGDICESGNGDIHVVWENWDATPDIGWSRSSDGGLTWSGPVEITNFQNVGKIPLLAHYGASNSGDVIMSCGKADGKTLWYNHFNGNSWSGYGASTGTNYNSEYELFGMCRSLQDGSTYRCSAWGDHLYFMRYNGYGWNYTQTNTPNQDFFPRQSIAVNPAGQVMMTWDYNSDFWSCLYTPGAGWGPLIAIQDEGSESHQGTVTAISGTNDFYAAYTRSMNRIRGKRWTGGAWQAEEVISGDQPQRFTLNAQVAAAPDGSLYVCWEYWEPIGANERAQAYCSVKLAAPPPPSGTISGFVRDQFGVGVSGASVTTSGTGSAVTTTNGSYSMSVPVGTYNVLASKDFYGSQIAYNVAVSQNQTTAVDLSLTGQAPAPVASLTVAEGNTSNGLTWQNPPGANFTGTVVRYSTTAPPTDPSQGTLLVDQPASPGSQGQITHSDLTNGNRVYYTAFAYFAGSSRYYSAGVSASGSPAVRPDFDRDGDVDQQDFGHIQECLSGPFAPQGAPECFDANLDQSADGDVDQTDVQILLDCLGGSNVQAASACAD